MDRRVVELDGRIWFPDPREAVASGRYQGLVAFGGDLGTERLLLAYRLGIFPWTDDPITWWSPNPRSIFEFDHIHVPKSLARVRRQAVSLLGNDPKATRELMANLAFADDQFVITANLAFREVIEACAHQPRPGQWIGTGMIEAYTALHRLGHAHSVECWWGSRLVGGVYGVATGGLFAGESMFHLRSNASKVALVALIEHLRDRSFQLFDIQMTTPVTLQLGATNISREAYLNRLAAAIELECAFV